MKQVQPLLLRFQPFEVASIPRCWREQRYLMSVASSRAFPAVVGLAREAMIAAVKVATAISWVAFDEAHLVTVGCSGDIGGGVGVRAGIEARSVPKIFRFLHVAPARSRVSQIVSGAGHDEPGSGETTGVDHQPVAARSLPPGGITPDRGS